MIIGAVISEKAGEVELLSPALRAQKVSLKILLFVSIKTASEVLIEQLFFYGQEFLLKLGVRVDLGRQLRLPLGR